MVKDIRTIRGASIDDKDVQSEAEACAKVFETNQSEVLSMSDFLTGVGQLKFRGTSMLLRSPNSVKEVLGTNSGGSDSSSSNNGDDDLSTDRKRKRTNSPNNFDPCEFLRESHRYFL